MANVIHIKEENNRLEFCGTYSPVVCGNTNYFVIFQFSEDWQQINTKTAIFIADGKRKSMKFDGNVLKLPAFVDSSYFELLVCAKGDGEFYATTPLKIRLEPLPIGDLIMKYFGETQEKPLKKKA